MSEVYMEMALQLAEQAAGQTSPNPPVGAVLVKEGRIVGMGAHLQAGEGHAERLALDMAGAHSRNADLYVTLEPCSHHGKTSPCADAVIEAGVKRVFIAAKDPNPLVSGKGIEKLRNAAIEVTEAVCEQRAFALYEPFFHFIRTKTPFVTMKTAMTMDGKIAAENGDSKWVTGVQARLDGHYLRHTHDAILAGVNTILQDDPLLTTRLPQGGLHPIRVILDSWLQTPANSQVIQNNQAETWIFCCSEADQQREQALAKPHVKIFRMASVRAIEDILLKLGSLGIMTLLVEGGAAVHASFVKTQNVQRIICYMAPKLLGGRDSLSVLTGENPLRMAEAFELTFEHAEMIGPDLKITARPKKGG